MVAALAAEADPGDAVFLQRFFKTGPGQYGEGDVFIGVRVPRTRAVARRFRDLSFDEIDALLDGPVHEHRLAGLIILNGVYARSVAVRTEDDAVRDEAVRRYLAAVDRGQVNNWDLVDASAPYVLGDHLYDRPRDPVFELVGSDDLWHRRVGVLTTFGFIRRGDASTTLSVAETLLDDPEPLIHKAVGWMLREVGKRVSGELLTGFLDAHAARMPRTMLGYATEHLTPEQRAEYRRAGR